MFGAFRKLHLTSLQPSFQTSLIHNHDDVGKFKWFTSKHCATENYVESENKEEFT